MFIKHRPDGHAVKVPGFTKVMPILMPSRTESVIYMKQTFVLDKTMAFIEEWNSRLPEGRRKLTVMQVLLTALARTVAMRPRLNRFVSHYRYYQRNNISFSFVTKKTLSDDGKEVNVTMPFRADDTLETVNERFTAFVGTAKSDEGNKSDKDVDVFDRLPIPVIRLVVWLIKFLDRRNLAGRGIIRMLPFYCTAFLTNVGSLKLDAPYHHNFEMGNTGIFVALGRVRKESVLTEDGSVSNRTVVDLTYSFDDRIVDGIYSGRAMKLLQDLTENPEQLIEEPNIAPKHLEELALTEKGWSLWADI